MAVSDQTRAQIAEINAGAAENESGLAAQLVWPGSELFVLLEIAERECLPEMVDIPEGNYAFWVVARDGQLLHGMRLGFPELRNGVLAPYLVHQLVESGQITANEIDADLRGRGLRISHCVSVESNFRITPEAPRASALFAYLGLTKFLLETGRDGALAHQNDAAQRSFERAKLGWSPLSSTITLRTPSLLDSTTLDDRYFPVALPASGTNQRLMESMPEATPSIPRVDIDLREPSEETQRGPSEPSETGEIYR